jgi:flagellar protein FlaJ
MVFQGLKKFFNRIGNFTVDSSQKVGEGAQKVSSGVQTPVKKIGKITFCKISSQTQKKG